MFSLLAVRYSASLPLAKLLQSQDPKAVLQWRDGPAVVGAGVGAVKVRFTLLRARMYGFRLDSPAAVGMP